MERAKLQQVQAGTVGEVAVGERGWTVIEVKQGKDAPPNMPWVPDRPILRARSSRAC